MRGFVCSPMTRATDGCTARGGFWVPAGAATLGLKAPSGFLAWVRARIERGVNSGIFTATRSFFLRRQFQSCQSGLLP